MPGSGEDRPELQDEVLQAEIDLVADLVVAASDADGPLTQAEIDRALGLAP